MALKRLRSLALCAGVFLAVAMAQPPAKGTISGTTIDSETGDPVRKAIVTLTVQGTPRRWATTRTDGSGRFQFEGLPAGKYDLRANKGLEGNAIYGANDVRGLGDLITLGNGETVGGIKLRFLHSASVSGHMYDSDGEPLAGVNVNLLRQGRNLGAPILTNYRGGTTDDRGEYHILNVEPGQYYVRSMALNAGRRFGPVSGQAMFVDQFYGGALEAKDASPIHVRGGENLGGIDFRLNSEPGVQVRGRVTGVPEEVVPPVTPSAPSPGPGMPVVLSNRFMQGPAIQIMISPPDTGGQRWSSGTSAQGPEHRFQTPEVPAGRYRVEATLRSGNKSYGAFQTLDLHAGSGEIVLALEPAKDVRGTVRVEGQAAQRPNSGSLRVQLSRPGGAAGNISAQVGADGRFLLEQVPSGDWQLAITPVPPGFLKSATLGEKDVLFTPFDVGAGGDAPLNIVVSMNTATLEGELDAGSSDAKRAGIVLAPVAGPYHDLTRFYYGGAADDKGKFKLEGIAPGKYKVFALEKMAAANFRNPEAIDQLYELGEAVELPEGATVQAQPKLIPLDRAQKVLP